MQIKIADCLSEKRSSPLKMHPIARTVSLVHSSIKTKPIVSSVTRISTAASNHTFAVAELGRALGSRGDAAPRAELTATSLGTRADIGRFSGIDSSRLALREALLLPLGGRVSLADISVL